MSPALPSDRPEFPAMVSGPHMSESQGQGVGLGKNAAMSGAAFCIESQSRQSPETMRCGWISNASVPPGQANPRRQEVDPWLPGAEGEDRSTAEGCGLGGVMS